MKHRLPPMVCSMALVDRLNSFRAYMVIHKIHLMNRENAATLVPDTAR